jgi:hypothetical protein
MLKIVGGLVMNLRLKVYTRDDGKEFVVSHFMFKGEWGIVFCMSDDETFQLNLSVEEYNKIPYRYFIDTGPAPKP